MDVVQAGLSFDWFDFPPRAPQRFRSRQLSPAMSGGHPVTYALALDSREIPFRWIRNEESAAARPTLLLLHGMGITVGSFWPVASYLFQSHDLLLIDYNSFSAPDRWPLGQVTLRHMAAGAWKIVQALELESVSLLGSSLGGGLAILMALMAPHNVQSLILSNPAVYPQPLPLLYRLARVPIWGELMMALTPAERLVEGVSRLGYSSPERMPLELRAAYIRNMRPYKARLLLMDVIRQLPTHAREVGVSLRLNRVTAPTLVLWGMQEHLLPPDTGERLARELPHAQLHTFDDLAHLPHEEAPHRLGPMMHAFLHRLGSNARLRRS